MSCACWWNEVCCDVKVCLCNFVVRDFECDGFVSVLVVCGDECVLDCFMYEKCDSCVSVMLEFVYDVVWKECWEHVVFLFESCILN